MNALLIDHKDNVAVVTCPVEPGMDVVFKMNETRSQLKASTAVPLYHKIAVRDIMAGETIIKYGHRIGRAICDIHTGEHIHCHNVASDQEQEGG